MAIKRKATAKWEGTLKEGAGHLKLGSGAFEGPYSFKSRFEDGTGTNPEELIGAAEAGCFAMAMSLGLEEAGFKPESIDADADVSLVQVDGGFKIESIHLMVEASIPDISEDKFQEVAEATKKNCPVSVALSATDIILDAKLK